MPRRQLLPLLTVLVTAGCDRTPVASGPSNGANGVGSAGADAAGAAVGAAGAGGGAGTSSAGGAAAPRTAGASGAGGGSGLAGASGAAGTRSARPVVVAVVDDEVLLSSVGGEVSSVYRFAAPDIPAGTLAGGWVTVGVRHGYVLATLSATSYDQTTGWRQGDRAVLLEDGARVRWEKAFTAADLGPSHQRGFSGQLGEAGDCVLSVGWQQLYVDADGTEQPLDGVRSTLAPLGGPVIPVVWDAPTTFDSSFGWWRPGRPIDLIGHPLTQLFVASPAESRFVFESRDVAGQRVLVDARPAGFDVRPWPAEVGDTIARFGAGAWQGDDRGDEVVRWNVLTGELTHLRWALPDGMRRLGHPWFDDDGSLIVALRNDYLAGVYRSPAAGPDWTPIGKTLGDVETVTVTSASGTYVIDTEGTNDRFVPEQTWQAAPAGQEPALRGATHQIVRPAVAAASEVTPAMWTVQLSPDGQRTVYWRRGSSGYSLVLRDVRSSGERPITSRSLPRAYQMAWYP